MILNDASLMLVNSTDLTFPILQWNYSRFTPVEVGTLHVTLNELTSFKWSVHAGSTSWGVRWNLEVIDYFSCVSALHIPPVRLPL